MTNSVRVAQDTNPLGFRLAKREVAVATLVFGALLAMSTLFIRTGDDWAWGSEIGVDRLRSFFADYNGRYVGNLAVLVLSRSAWITPLVTAFVLTTLLLILVRMSEVPVRIGLPMALALLVGMPSPIWRQTVPWVSGFTNYALSTAFVVVFIVHSSLALFEQRDADVSSDGQPSPDRLHRLAAVGVVAFLGSLILENVTLAVVVVSGGLVALGVVRRSVVRSHIAWFVGSALGAATMFSNGAYGAVAEGEKRYQSVAADATPREMLGRIAREFPTLGFGSAWILFLFSAIGALLLLQNRRANSRIWALLVALGMFVLATVSSLFYVYVRDAYEVGVSRSALVASAAFWFGVVALVFGSGISGSRLVMCGMAILLAGLIVAPLVVANPIGPRNFLTPYVLGMLVVFACCPTIEVGPWPVAIAATAASVLVVWVGFQHLVIKVADERRIDIVREAVEDGQAVVQIPALPYPSVTHGGDPTGAVFGPRFIKYYGFPDDTTLIVTPCVGRGCP